VLFAIGTRVKFLHSADEGVVSELLGDDMVNVLLDGSGMEIPAFVEDLVRAEDYIDENPSVKAKIVPGKKLKESLPPERPPIESQYAILKSFGVQLAFEPVGKPDEAVEKYQIYLINDTRYEAIYSLVLSLRGNIGLERNGKLGPISAVYIGDLLFDQLNDSPVFDIECRRATTEGAGPRLFKSLKVKPKQFFSKVRTAPILNKAVHLFRIFEKLQEDETAQKKEEDLRTYTQKNIPMTKERFDLQSLSSNEVLEYAEFLPEIDLHIENLARNHKKLSNSEILRIQLQHFEAYIQKAIQLGVKRVFIIHGVGKGRLRDSIATRLIRIPEVKTFVNEYHPRYGHGATEVVFEE
jgi:hypothetical protein